MTTIRDEVHQLVEALVDDKLSEVRDFLKVLASEPEELTGEELTDVLEGEEEFKRGEWVRWENVRRKDV